MLSPHPSAIYTGVSNALSRIWTTEGWYALWRGVNSVVVGAGPAHALYFATYEHCKVMLGVKEQDEDHKLWEPGECFYCVFFFYRYIGIDSKPECKRYTDVGGVHLAYVGQQPFVPGMGNSGSILVSISKKRKSANRTNITTH
jgi:hypothetical protein